MQARSLMQTFENTLTERYRTLVREEKIHHDAAQEKAVAILYRLQHELEMENLTHNSSFFKRLFSSPEKQERPRGVYLYGEVGRGKSMLMDLFFETVPVQNKRRVHFHAFMLEVHERLHVLRQEPSSKSRDLIEEIAREIAKNTHLFCFDELQVTDITDAMILGRLFAELFRHDVVIVATSNRAPDALYKDGLQRERFLPFIEQIKRNNEVFELQGQQDYRLSQIKSLSTVFFTPLGKKSETFAETAFKELSNGHAGMPVDLPLRGRKVHIPCAYADAAKIDFASLCAHALGAEDYLEIAQEFGTVILTDIPQLSKEMRNEAKRFVTLIDALYEHKVKLICTAEVPPEKLYPGGDGAFEFQRTVSRLMEMQSEEYLKAAHVG